MSRIGCGRVRLRQNLAALLVGAGSVCAVASASARPYLPPSGHLFAGLTGGTSIVPYERMVGKHPPVFELSMTWNTPTAWLAATDSAFRSRLGLALGTAPGYALPGVISPEGIALGRSDRFLVAMNRNLAHSGRVVYLRIMGEMNGYWNAYAPFNADGSFRGVPNLPHFYIEAWRRTVLILRGGLVARINRRLRALGLPPIRARLRPHDRLPAPKLAFLWVPQDAGSPEIAANAPGVFWPGSAYVDWVGTDFYASYPNFRLLDQFYDEFRGKPFVLSEWALYGADDPGFVRALFAWVRAHPRVRMLNYYQGYTTSTPANLVRYPLGRAALRQALRSPRFLAYPPEYAHPRRVRHRKPPSSSQPANPPLPPRHGPGPTPASGQPPAPPMAPPGASSRPPTACVTPMPLCGPAL